MSGLVDDLNIDESKLTPITTRLMEIAPISAKPPVRDDGIWDVNDDIAGSASNGAEHGSAQKLYGATLSDLENDGMLVFPVLHWLLLFKCQIHQFMAKKLTLLKMILQNILHLNHANLQLTN